MDRALALVREALPIVQSALAGRDDVIITWGVTRPSQSKPVAVSLTLRSWTPAERTLDDNASILDATLALVIAARENERSEERMLVDYYQPCAAPLEQAGWDVDAGQAGIEDIRGDLFRVVEAGFTRVAI